MSYPILDSLRTPEDVKKLSLPDLYQLSEDLRNRVNEVVRETGGHLGPNLGAVEIILACHVVFDLKTDRLVFDVGHQSYPHKLLTGRNPNFHSLRQKDGVSGYPHPEESAYDVYRSGHASTAISTSLGILEGFLSQPNLSDRKVVALVGDGSLTGGMAFEGLNHAGHLGKNLIVILNDNSMSISPTVGALSKSLNRFRHHNFVKKMEQDVVNFVQRIPRIGKRLFEALRIVGRQSRHLMNPGQIFIDLGFEYIGPVEGHKVEEIVEALRTARKAKGPMLVHVLTEKGLGYKPEGPTGKAIIGPHALSPGQRKKEEAERKKKEEAERKKAETPAPTPYIVSPPLTVVSSLPSYSKAFATALTRLTKKYPQIRAITAAMEEGTALDLFKKEFPDRYYDVGICEQHATGFSAGLATAGLRPVFAVYSTFFQRAFDQVFHEIVLQGKLPVVFCVDRAGLVGDDGPSHHGVYDISYLRLYPNLYVMAPKDARELDEMLDFSLQQDYSCAIRYPRETVPAENYFASHEKIELGRFETLREGKDICLIAYGAQVALAVEAAKILSKEGIEVGLVNGRFAKPILPEPMTALAKKYKALITLEEGTVVGGFGSAVAEVLFEANAMPREFHRLGVPDRLIEHASRADQLRECGLDTASIAAKVKEILSRI